MPAVVTVGQILVKKNTDRIITTGGVLKFIVSCINPAIIAAVLCIAAAPLMYIKALGTVPLSEAFAFNSLNYILVFVFGRFILGEKPDVYRFAGVVLITAGFLLPFIAEAAGA